MPCPRRFDEDRKILARLFLTDEVGEPLRPQACLRGVVLAALRRHQLAASAADVTPRAHRSGPRLYLLGRRSPIGTTLGVLPFGTITRAARS